MSESLTKSIDQTWFLGSKVGDVRRFRDLEGDNAKLKKLPAEAIHDIESLKGVAQENGTVAGAEGGGEREAGEDRDLGATWVRADRPVAHGDALRGVAEST